MRKYDILKGRARMLDQSLTEVEIMIRKFRSWVDAFKKEIERIDKEAEDQMVRKFKN